ncbi:cytochrome c1 [Aureimonas sp. ME7]|uniref:cytochrome c1 n=1 Tax=Aureimonas sp. ME7 TaxID=2744252 RepID=UPI0015F71DDD|nr:cytochrome c1 [Aureimonas sp. ME7]
MKKLLPAFLAAGVVFAPVAGFAQESAAPAATTATEGQIEGAAPGAAPDAARGTEAAVAGEPAEAHATPHYPLKKPAELSWTFAGPFGHWDLGQLQRGLKIYKEVCSNCHSMNLVSFRNFEALGYSDEQVRALAAQYQITDPAPNAQGEMFERAGIPSDRLPSPYPNPEAAAAALGGAHPPDLSLIAKARSVERGFPTFLFDLVPWKQYAEGGPDYIHGLLTGYGEEVPAHITVQPGTYYNPHFIAGPALAMAPPLSDGQVSYDDGAPETLEQYSRDVSAFLMWAAEPHLVERKATGFVVMIFLIGFAIMLYLVKRRVWADTPH